MHHNCLIAAWSIFRQPLDTTTSHALGMAMASASNVDSIHTQSWRRHAPSRRQGAPITYCTRIEESAAMTTTMRVARPTDDIDALLPFYRDGLGLQVLGAFQDHQGFDGVMLGHPGLPYHFEFTHRRGYRVGRAPNREHLVVFYLHEPSAWEVAVARMRSAGFEPVTSYNPYWDLSGKTFQDPDGYRVALQSGDYPASAAVSGYAIV
jgi:catechol 2,3-dioxygenase-like lactoylglutathione lyase family enzyme